MKKILFIIGLILLIQNVYALDNKTYYCLDFYNNGNSGLYCYQIDKYNVSQQYNNSMSDLNLIENSNPGFNQTGFNQVVWAVKREAQIEELILKFLNVIYQILT